MLYRKVCQLSAAVKTQYARYNSAFICHLAEPATLYNWFDYIAGELADDEGTTEPDRFDLSINGEQPRHYPGKKVPGIQGRLAPLIANRTLLSAEVRAGSTYHCSIVYPPRTEQEKTLYREQFSIQTKTPDGTGLVKEQQSTGYIVDQFALKQWLQRIEPKGKYTLTINEESPVYRSITAASARKKLMDRAASRDLFFAEIENERRLEMCSVVYRESFAEFAFTEEPTKSLIDDLRLSVLMPAKAQVRRGSTGVTLMDSGETHGRSIWDWWSLFEDAGIHLESVLTCLAHEEIGPEWKLEYRTWSSFLHSGRYYCLVKKSSRK